jgi:hypothetical protein
MDGWIVTDDNLLACSDRHINNVFSMLARQPHAAQFVGGLDARLMTPGIAFQLSVLRPKSMYFAYDAPDVIDPLKQAGMMMQQAGFRRESYTMRCYVLIGYDGDTFDAAEKRLRATWEAGFFPMAMLYRDNFNSPRDTAWARFQRVWARPHIVGAKLKITAGATCG